MCDCLNYTYTGAVAIVDEYFGENILPVSQTTVECAGSELSIVDCMNSTASCNPYQDAGVVCQGESIVCIGLNDISNPTCYLKREGK